MVGLPVTFVTKLLSTVAEPESPVNTWAVAKESCALPTFTVRAARRMAQPILTRLPNLKQASFCIVLIKIVTVR
jgi:hypothetical protein